MDQPGKFAIPARGQLNRETECFPVRVRARDSTVLSRVSLLISILRLTSGAYLQDSSRVPRRRPFISLNRYTPSGKSRVYRVTHLRTHGVHCRESAGTGAAVLKVFPNECYHFAGHHGPISMRLSFPYPLLV